MTDSQELLAEYATNGSEEAFRELVTRYVNLVYSTALRLVSGDSQLAEDVTPTVVISLARKGRALSSGVMLGGWLHRDTCFVAAKTMRSERRRKSRERYSVEMNTWQDHSGSDLMQVAPILDEAIDQLGAEDRIAILLRFFEQLDFRSVGEVLGSNEDAARMRVNRALEKLHSLLKHRGVSLSVAALGTALATEAVTAAPVGLAATITAAALSGTTVTTMSSFGSYPGGVAYPMGGLALSGSTLYGMTSQGAYNSQTTYYAGTVFSIATSASGGSNTPTVKYQFIGSGNPNGGLVISGSTLYGMTTNAGNGYGTVFSLPTSGGTPTTLHAFTDTYTTTWVGGQIIEILPRGEVSPLPF